MRTLSRPMFNMGGPIKQGVMHGIREPHKHGERVGANLVGDPIYPKDKTGRAHHAVFGGLGIGALAAISRFGPAAWRGLKAAKTYAPWSKNLGKWGRTKDIFWPKTGVRGPKLKGELYKTPFKPVPGSEKAGFGVGSYIGTNPITSFGLASTVPQAGYLGAKVAGAAPGALWSGAKRYADMVIPGDQSSWWKDKEPPTGVPLNPNLQNLIAAVDTPDKPTKLSDAQKKAFANKQREERVQKYLDMMGYDRSKKTAIADALIDASKIVGDRGSLDLKNITQELINPVIQATSKRLDKPEQIREAVGLMSTKAEIEKDLSAETDALAKQLTLTKIAQGERSLEQGFETDIRNLLLSARTPPAKKQLEQYARLTADKYGESFTMISDEEKKTATGDTETEKLQSLVTGDGIYMIGDNLIRVVGGVPKHIV